MSSYRQLRLLNISRIDAQSLQLAQDDALAKTRVEANEILPALVNKKVDCAGFHGQ
jgi:hypothetical protein